MGLPSTLILLILNSLSTNRGITPPQQTQLHVNILNRNYENRVKRMFPTQIKHMNLNAEPQIRRAMNPVDDVRLPLSCLLLK